jgi:hypothetical protein
VTRWIAPAIIAIDKVDMLQAHERTASVRLERLDHEG